MGTKHFNRHENIYYDDLEYENMSNSDRRTEAWLRGEDISEDEWWDIPVEIPVGLLGLDDTEVEG